MDEQHPLTTPFLFIQLQPKDSRPTAQDVVKLLSAFLPIRFQNHRDSSNDGEPPHFRQIEFQQLDTAQRAYAIVQNIPLLYSIQQNDTAPIQLSLSVNEDPANDATPADGTKLNVSELPESHYNAAALYNLFKPFGPIYRIELGTREGSATVTYYSTKPLKEAISELHCTEIDGMSISVSKATIHDLKNTFKNPSYPSSSNVAGNGGRRAFSAGSAANGNSTLTSPVNGNVPRRTSIHASGQRAGSGAASKSYGSSASAEPYNPARKSPSSPPQSGLLEISPGVPLVIRSVPQPVSMIDSSRLLIQNIPRELKAAALFMVLRDTFVHHATSSSSSMLETNSGGIEVLEASLLIDRDTDESVGVALVRLGNNEQAELALEILNGNFLRGYDDKDDNGGNDSEGGGASSKRIPLKVMFYEPKGPVEKGLKLQEQKQEEDVAPMGGTRTTTKVPENGNEATKNADSTKEAPSTPSSSVASPSIPTVQIAKYRKLLSTALDDFPTSEAQSLFPSSAQKLKMLDLLIERLSEAELKRCIFEEEYLKMKCEAFKLKDLIGEDIREEENEIAKMDDSGTSEEVQVAPARKGSESPTRVYGRKDLLKLYIPHSPVHVKTEAMIKAISPTTSTHPLPSTSPSYTGGPKRAKPSEDMMTIEDLVQLTVKEIIELASGTNPPSVLAMRNEETVKSVEDFLDGIKSLKPAQQKQRIGEKIFKVFKNAAPGMKNISKRTVKLLDGEDLGALMHLVEEFPEVLVAKALSCAV